jgi:hypothetical protein
MFCVNFWNPLSFYYFCFLQYISNIFGCCFIIFAYFISVFIESSVSFVFRIDSLATRETIIAVLFLLIFWFFYCFLSHIYIFELRCYAGSIWCWFEFRKKVRREVWACEDIKNVWAKHERCEDIFFTTNQFLQVISCQIKITHRPLPM